MGSTVASIMEMHVVALKMEDTVETAEQALSNGRFSCVPIVDEKGEGFGIVSAADMVRFHSQKKNPKAVRVWEMCTYEAVTVAPDLPLKEAARLMLGKKIHHLIVARSDRKKIEGIVSSLDIIAALLRETGEQDVRWR
jgi:CBS-domain-containing membrane protein